jgi:hypothetical protein
VGRKNVDDGHEYVPIIDAGAATALWSDSGRWQDGVNNVPQIVGYQSKCEFDHSDSPHGWLDSQ